MPRRKRGETEEINIKVVLTGDLKGQFLYIQRQIGIESYVDIVRMLISEKAKKLGYKIRVEEPSQSQSEVAPQNQSQPRSEED